MANATLQKALEEWSMPKDDFLKSNEANKNYIRVNYGGAIREILDWLKHPYTPQQNLRELTFDEALEKSREWHEQLETLGGDVDYVEPKENEILIEYPETPDGRKYYWVRIPSSYCDVESRRMGHCGRTGQGNDLISLRSINPFGTGHTVNESHVTIAYNIILKKIVQAKGKKNQKPAEKYHGYIYDLILHLAEKGRFKGFSAEYQSSDDYGWNDMSKEQISQLKETNEDVFDSFTGEIVLYRNGLGDAPNTKFTYEGAVGEVSDLFTLGLDMRDDIIETVLAGDVYDIFEGSWDWYYRNAEDYVDNLNEANYAEVIDEIVKITKLPKEKVLENGAKHYLAGDDEDFPADDFDNIARSIARAYADAEVDDYARHYYRRIEDTLEHYGNVLRLDDSGVKIEIDLAKILDYDTIQEIIEYTDNDDLSVIFEEGLNDYIDKPYLSFSDGYNAYVSDNEFNSYFELTNYAKGGKIGRPKKKTSGGEIDITQEYRKFDEKVFNEVEDEILHGLLVKKGNQEIGIVRVEEDIYDKGVGYIFGLEVFDEGKGYGKQIIKKIFELHPTQQAFAGKATSTSKGFWSNLGAEFESEYDFVLTRNSFKDAKIKMALGGKISSHVKNLLFELEQAYKAMNNDKFDSISNQIHEISDNQGLTQNEYEIWDDLREKNNEQRLNIYFKKSIIKR